MVASVAIVTTIGLAPSTAGAMPHPAAGLYTAIDSVDGSNLTLRVVGNASHARLVLFDDSATLACPASASAAVVVGSGSWDVNQLDVTVRIRCLGEANPPDLPLTFEYLPGSDTIVSGGDTYVRA